MFVRCLVAAAPNAHSCPCGVFMVQILAPYKALSDNIIQNVLVLQLFMTMFSGLLVHLHQPDAALIPDEEDSTIRVSSERAPRHFLVSPSHAVSCALANVANSWLASKLNRFCSSSG